ncbi:MAG: universal stress protein [Thermoleophilia bacterium]|nr:universal stress protein [Thermoleophilia bacterium]
MVGDLPVRVVSGRTVDAIASVGEYVDLLILGARGRSGIRALGSVSERVAHRVPSSVLVVRAE